MTTFLSVLLLSPLAVMLFRIVQGRRSRRALPSFLIPSADETAKTVRRFRAAARSAYSPLFP